MVDTFTQRPMPSPSNARSKAFGQVFADATKMATNYSAKQLKKQAHATASAAILNTPDAQQAVKDMDDGTLEVANPIAEEAIRGAGYKQGARKVMRELREEYATSDLNQYHPEAFRDWLAGEIPKRMLAEGLDPNDPEVALYASPQMGALSKELTNAHAQHYTAYTRAEIRNVFATEVGQTVQDTVRDAKGAHINPDQLGQGLDKMHQSAALTGLSGMARDAIVTDIAIKEAMHLASSGDPKLMPQATLVLASLKEIRGGAMVKSAAVKEQIRAAEARMESLARASFKDANARNEAALTTAKDGYMEKTMEAVLAGDKEALLGLSQSWMNSGFGAQDPAYAKELFDKGTSFMSTLSDYKELPDNPLGVTALDEQIRQGFVDKTMGVPDALGIIQASILNPADKEKAAASVRAAAEGQRTKHGAALDTHRNDTVKELKFILEKRDALSRVLDNSKPVMVNATAVYKEYLDDIATNGWMLPREVNGKVVETRVPRAQMTVPEYREATKELQMQVVREFAPNIVAKSEDGTPYIMSGGELDRRMAESREKRTAEVEAKIEAKRVKEEQENKSVNLLQAEQQDAYKQLATYDVAQAYDISGMTEMKTTGGLWGLGIPLKHKAIGNYPTYEVSVYNPKYDVLQAKQAKLRDAVLTTHQALLPEDRAAKAEFAIGLTRVLSGVGQRAITVAEGAYLKPVAQYNPAVTFQDGGLYMDAGAQWAKEFPTEDSDIGAWAVENKDKVGGVRFVAEFANMPKSYKTQGKYWRVVPLDPTKFVQAATEYLTTVTE